MTTRGYEEYGSGRGGGGVEDWGYDCDVREVCAAGVWVVGEEHVARQEGGSPFVDLEAYSILHAAEMDGDVGGVGDEAAWRMVGG